MRQILTVKNQTLADVAVQEYGNVAAIFQIVEDNPHLGGLNDLPPGYYMPAEADFDIAFPVKPGTVIYLQDYIDIENTGVARQLENVIS